MDDTPAIDACLTATADRRRGRALLIACMAIVGAAVAVIHWPVLSAKALAFDDQQYIVDNVLVRNPGWSSAGRFLKEVTAPSTVAGYYQPLAMISLMVDDALGGRPDDLRPFHRTSLILHVLTTMGLCALMYVLFKKPISAALAALIFGAHPMTVEVVAWTSERKAVLAGFFAVGSILFYAAYCRAQAQHRRQAGGLYYAGCMATFVLALLAKPTVTPLPLMLLLMDGWPLGRWSRRAVWEKVPLLVISAASAVVTFVSQRQTADAALPSEFGVLRVPIVLCHNIYFYLEKIAWPVNLSSHYPYPKPLWFTNPAVLKGIIGTALLFMVLAWSLRRTRTLAAAWLIFFVGLLPTMQIVGFSMTIATDNYAYFPAVGLLMALTSGLSRITSSGPTPGDRKTRCILLAVVAAIIVAAEARQTRSYLREWESSERLCQHMVALAPEDAPLRNMLGVALKDRGQLKEAAAEFVKAIQLDPNHAVAYVNLAGLFVSEGRLTEAVEVYREALRIKPDLAQAHNNLANTLCRLGRLQEAVPQFEDAIRLKPTLLQPRTNLGKALRLLGRFEEAERVHREAIRLSPRDAETYYQWGLDLEALGRLREAVDAYRQALERYPSHEGARRKLAATTTRPSSQ